MILKVILKIQKVATHSTKDSQKIWKKQNKKQSVMVNIKQTFLKSADEGVCQSLKRLLAAEQEDNVTILDPQREKSAPSVAHSSD